MKNFFLLSALSLANLFSLSCLATTVSLNQYDRIYHAPVTWDRTVTEFKNVHAFTVLLDNGQLFSLGSPTYWLGLPELIQAPVVPKGRSVKEIFSSANSFTALLDNNTMLCWSANGADVRVPFIAPERKICSIISNSSRFVALLDNGRVVEWGDAETARDFYQQLPPTMSDNGLPVFTPLPIDSVPKSLSDLEEQGQKVISVTSSWWAFAAVVINPDTAQQTIISWENYDDIVTDSTGKELNATIEIPAGIKVTSIAANDYAFAALLDNGTIKAWGDKNCGGEAPLFPSDKKIVSLAATNSAFTAIFEDGTMQSWGDQQSGGKTPLLPAGSTVTKIFASVFDFAALLSGGDHDGDILSWGCYSRSYYSRSECQIIKVGMPIKSVVSNAYAFAAIRNDGSVIAWGEPHAGGDDSSLPPGKRVQSITPGITSFTALFEDGTIHSWGYDLGGEPTNMPADSQVVAITSTGDNYMGLLDNGSLFSWGGYISSTSDHTTLIELPKGTKALWMASPFEKYVLKPTSSQ